MCSRTIECVLLLHKVEGKGVRASVTHTHTLWKRNTHGISNPVLTTHNCFVVPHLVQKSLAPADCQLCVHTPSTKARSTGIMMHSKGTHSTVTVTEYTGTQTGWQHWHFGLWSFKLEGVLSPLSR